jgi:hypothetical protein
MFREGRDQVVKQRGRNERLTAGVQMERETGKSTRGHPDLLCMEEWESASHPGRLAPRRMDRSCTGVANSTILAPGGLRDVGTTNQGLGPSDGPQSRESDLQWQAQWAGVVHGG